MKKSDKSIKQAEPNRGVIGISVCKAANTECLENPRQKIAKCQLSTKFIPPALLSRSLTNVWN